jgi:hypothetical protein
MGRKLEKIGYCIRVNIQLEERRLVERGTSREDSEHLLLSVGVLKEMNNIVFVYSKGACTHIFVLNRAAFI